MCRNIRPLFNFEPAVTDSELHNAALQYVRKISGMRVPSKINQETFDRAVEEIASASRSLVDGLETTAAPRNREEEKAKARERWRKRAATIQAVL